NSRHDGPRFGGATRGSLAARAHAVCQFRLRPLLSPRAAGVLVARPAPGREMGAAPRLQLLFLLCEREATVRWLADAVVLRRADRRLDPGRLLRRARHRRLARALLAERGARREPGRQPGHARV